MRQWIGRLRIRWPYLCQLWKENNANGDNLWPIAAPALPVKPGALPRKESGQLLWALADHLFQTGSESRTCRDPEGPHINDWCNNFNEWLCADVNEQLIASATGQRIVLNFWFLSKTSGYRYFPHKQKWKTSAWYQRRTFWTCRHTKGRFNLSTLRAHWLVTRSKNTFLIIQWGAPGKIEVQE